MGSKPDVPLLANGDILVPVKNNGAWSMSRLAPDDADYVGWLCLIQKRDRDPGLLARGVSFWVSAVIVFFGFWSFIAVAALIAHAL